MTELSRSTADRSAGDFIEIRIADCGQGSIWSCRRHKGSRNNESLGRRSCKPHEGGVRGDSCNEIRLNVGSCKELPLPVAVAGLCCHCRRSCIPRNALGLSIRVGNAVCAISTTELLRPATNIRLRTLSWFEQVLVLNEY